MSVGVLKVKFALRGVSSLKEKRSIVQPFINKLKKNYNISVTELDGEDRPTSATLGFAHIAKSSDLNHRKLSRLLQEAEREKNLQIEDHSTEVIR